MPDRISDEVDDGCSQQRTGMKKRRANLQESDNSFNDDSTCGGNPELCGSRVSPAPIIDGRTDCTDNAEKQQDSKIERDLMYCVEHCNVRM
jgi:hypothetical protein